MIGDNGGNQFSQYVGQNVRNHNGYNAVQNVKNQNPNKNGNVVAKRVEGNANENNGNQISVEQGGGTLEQHSVTIEETRAYFESLYNNLAIKVEKVNSVNRKLKETNTDLTTKLASFGKQITTFNEEIENLNNQLSKEKSTVSSLYEEKKKFKSDFKICEDEILDKHIQLENKIKELDNILVKTGQSIQTMHMLSPKPDSFNYTEQKTALGYQNPFYLKQARQKQQSLYNGKILLEKHDSPAVYDSEETLQLAQEKVDESLDKHKAMESEIKHLLRTVIERFQAQLGDQKDKSKDTPCVSDTLDPLSQKLENENVELEFQVPPKVVELNDLSNPVTSNSVPTTKESKVMENDKVIAPGMFRIDPRVQSIAKTRRPQPRSNTKNDRVPFVSKSSCIKDKEVEVEEHHRNLLLSKNKKHMSSECNNINLDILNDKSKVIQICLWCVNSGCSKRITGNLKLLINFVWKFLGTVRFGNDHVAAIMGYGDL
ncbi:hypothetical protein Tco_0280735 [Tanacetum coccineum]